VTAGGALAPGVWAFDLDGTLIGSIRSERLRPGAAELLRALNARGIACVVWSAGGADYARRKAEQLGFAPMCDAWYAKADRDALGRYRVDHFAADHLPDVFVDDVPGDMPSGARVIAVRQFFGGNADDDSLTTILHDIDRHTRDGC
jgi:long-chain acyl-CoA synthetase